MNQPRAPAEHSCKAGMGGWGSPPPGRCSGSGPLQQGKALPRKPSQRKQSLEPLSSPIPPSAEDNSTPRLGQEWLAPSSPAWRTQGCSLFPEAPLGQSRWRWLLYSGPHPYSPHHLPQDLCHHSHKPSAKEPTGVALQRGKANTTKGPQCLRPQLRGTGAVQATSHM